MRVAMVEVAVTKIASIEVIAIDDRSAMRDISVVVVYRCTAMPIVSPVMPAPPKSSEEADAEADSKSNPHAAKEDSRHGIPAGYATIGAPYTSTDRKQARRPHRDRPVRLMIVSP